MSINISRCVWVFNCEAQCELPLDNRKSEIVEELLNWSTQDCNNALGMEIMQQFLPIHAPTTHSAKRETAG